MRSSLVLLTFLCSRTVPVHGTEPEAQPRRGLTAFPPRQTGNIYPLHENDSRAPFEANNSLPDRRQTNEQIPWYWCPETFHNPPKNCNQCGGDTLRHGQCDRLLISGRQPDTCRANGLGCFGYYCACTHDGEDHNPQVTSTAVVGGQTGTVIYEPQTLSDYTKLRASTTVTVTEVATTTDGGSSLETGLVVVFAGGLAWLAISESGSAAAIAAIQPPRTPPEESKPDDQSCPSNPKEDCQNCGGADSVGLCSSGADAGCPCDEVQHCPNEPPMCSDTDCGGDNGQSQCSAKGPINGCLCCPADPPDCTDSQCAGTNKQLCTAPKWDKCGCAVVAGDGLVEADDPASGSTDPASTSSVAAYVFTTIWAADYSEIPGWPVTATSQCSFVTTTHTTTDPMVSLPHVDCWCNCAGNMYGMTWGTSGSSTSSWCLTGDSNFEPTGWTHIHGSYCSGLPTSTASTTTSPPPASTTTPPPQGASPLTGLAESIFG